MFDWIKGKSIQNRRNLTTYNFHLKSQPQIVNSSTTITLTAYTNSFQTATIPCIYRWSVIKNGFKVQKPEFKGSSFRCEPSDVESLIQAEVISSDSQYGGTAVVQFGPVQVDPKLRKQIEASLVSGCAFITAHVVQGIQQRECQIRLLPDVAQINHVYSDASLSFNYSINQPQLQCMTKDNTRLIIAFSQKYHHQLIKMKDKLFDHPIRGLSDSFQFKNQNSFTYNTNRNLQIKFPNHNSRDLFIFLWKAYATKKQLSSPMMNNQFCKVNIPHSQSFDYLLEIQNLKKQIIKMDKALQCSQQQKLRYIQEINNLKTEIQSIIKSYTKIIREKFQNLHYLDNSLSSIGGESFLPKKYENLQNDNNHLNSRIHALTKEIDTIRFQPLKLQSTRQSNFIQPMINSTNAHQPRFNIKNLNDSPFSKKKTNDQSQYFNLLDDFQTSRISYISSIQMIGQNPQQSQKIEVFQNQQNQIQNMFNHFTQPHRIQDKNGKLKTDRMNQSVVHFSYNNKNKVNTTLNYSMTNNAKNLSQKKQKINELEIYGELLNSGNSGKYINKANWVTNQKKSLSRSNSVYQLNSFLGSQKTEKKICRFQDQQKEISPIILQMQSEIKSLKKLNQHLVQQNQKLNHRIKSLQITASQCQKMNQKVSSLQTQIQTQNQSSYVLNHSQQMSSQKNSANEDQLCLLKRQNQFLSNQNIKLSRACQKYMNEAKQSNRLRMQIIGLRQKIAIKNGY